MNTLQKCLLPVLLMAGLTVGAQNGQSIGTSDTSMALIPGGEFIMGKDAGNGSDFSPAHRVSIRSFLMDRYEVTNREYLRFCLETGYKYPEFWNTEVFKSGEAFLCYPVVGISWYDAKKYAEWAGKRLPTEAEWEYAARGGLAGMEYPNGNQWTLERAKQEAGGWKNIIEPVGQHEFNGYGLYDMGGNVWEWVNDVYSSDYYQISETDNPQGPQTGFLQVIRSGSWHSGAMCKKVYYRKGLPGSWCDFAVGFRCAKNAEATQLQ